MLFMEDIWNAGGEETKLGGPGMTVEIDESCCTKKKKYNRGSGGPKPDRWVFGMVERLGGGFAGKRRFWLVPNRVAGTLVPIIESHIKRGQFYMNVIYIFLYYFKQITTGTRIISGNYGAYHGLGERG